MPNLCWTHSACVPKLATATTLPLYLSGISGSRLSAKYTSP